MAPYDIEQLTEALAAGARAFLASLDGEEDTAGPFQAPIFNGPVAGGEIVDFDPLNDNPPFRPDPRADQHSPESRLASLVYLGSIARLNAAEGRGANAREITKFAIKAGYVNGRVVNGWNSRPDSKRSIENINGLRYVNEDTHRWIQQLSEELRINITGDITPIPVPRS